MLLLEARFSNVQPLGCPDLAFKVVAEKDFRCPSERDLCCFGLCPELNADISS